MIDTTQIILISVITVITIILTVVGIQLIFVLKELRIFLARANTVGEQLEKIGINVSHGYSELIGFFHGLKSFFKVLNLLTKDKDKNDKS